MDGDDGLDLEGVVAAIEATVRARVAAGEYPADLDQRLDVHYRRIVEQLPTPFDHRSLDDALSRVATSSHVDPAKIDTASGLPGGGTLHRAVARAVGRQTAGLAEQVNVFTAAVVDALELLAAAIRHPRSHEHADLRGALDVVLDTYSKPQPGTLRPVRLVAAAADSHAWARAGDALLGRAPIAVLGVAASEESVTRSLADGVATVSFVEPDPVQARRVAAYGVHVEVVDPLSWLLARDDSSLGGISLIDAVGRLSPEMLDRVIEVAPLKLREGGVVVAGGIEPRSIEAVGAAHAISPYALVHPIYLEALFSRHGFVTTVRSVDSDGAFAVVATLGG